MSNQQTDIVTGGDVRIFVQKGISPDEPYVYYGCMTLDGPEQAEGDPVPIYCPSSTQRNKWDIVEEAPTQPELGSSDFTQRMDRFLRDAWWDIRRNKCTFNMQAVLGKCQSPDDFTRWDAKILFSHARLTNFSLPQLNMLSGEDNNALDLSGSISFRDMVPIRRMKFGARGESVVVAEVLDGIFDDNVQCGDCGPASDGCQKAFFLTLANAGSPGLSSQVVYTDDGGNTMAAVDIPSLGGLSGTRIAAMGRYIVVISQDSGSHHYQDAEDILDGLTAWTQVTGGYVATKGPRAIYVNTSALAFVAAAGGYIYLMEDPTLSVEVLTDGSLTTQDLNDIHGFGTTIVAVGGSNAVLVSSNRGESFSLKTGPLAGIGLNAVWVLNNNVFFVGTANGRVYYTTDAGDSWTLVSVPADITIINDLWFVDEVVGFMAVQAGGSARVYRTTDSGRSWHNRDPHLSGLPTAERINFVTACDYNVAAAGGRKTAGGDGLVAIAE